MYRVAHRNIPMAISRRYKFVCFSIAVQLKVDHIKHAYIQICIIIPQSSL